VHCSFAAIALKRVRFRAFVQRIRVRADWH